ncbi:hypothetical protein [Aurantiacibacter sp. D1-12]|nr:hypothetical protein [Aurantiacibacter sp. D1-12]MDE1467566.1 hypothetical protein [Aurantiacibacter sp. D1-12]
MGNRIYTSSRNDAWSNPRPYTDASLRFAKHGRVLPMEEPSLLERLFGWR